MRKRKIIIVIIILAGIILSIGQLKKVNLNRNYFVGQVLDSLNGVKVFYNGGVNNVTERNVIDGYNIGLKYQCVEFVKRYYFEHYNHRMPDSYGHAKSFYASNIKDGELNIQRNLIQYSNPSKSKPKEGDLIIMESSLLNRFGHVCIVSKVYDKQIEIIQQNPGPFGKSRELFELKKDNDKWLIENDRILGWLRK